MIDKKDLLMEILYQSFLLRIWNKASQNHLDWHASLEDPSTHNIKTFNNPEALFTYLLEVSNLDQFDINQIKGIDK